MLALLCPLPQSILNTPATDILLKHKSDNDILLSKSCKTSCEDSSVETGVFPRIYKFPSDRSSSVKWGCSFWVYSFQRCLTTRIHLTWPLKIPRSQSRNTPLISSETVDSSSCMKGEWKVLCELWRTLQMWWLSWPALGPWAKFPPQVWSRHLQAKGTSQRTVTFRWGVTWYLGGYRGRFNLEGTDTDSPLPAAMKLAPKVDKTKGSIILLPLHSFSTGMSVQQVEARRGITLGALFFPPCLTWTSRVSDDFSFCFFFF